MLLDAAGLFWSGSNLFDLLEGRVSELDTRAVQVGRSRGGAGNLCFSVRQRAESYYQRQF